VKWHAIASYFVMTFAILWLGAQAVVAPRLLRGEALPKFSGILICPVMLPGLAVSGILLTHVIDDSRRRKDLLRGWGGFAWARRGMRRC